MLCAGARCGDTRHTCVEDVFPASNSKKKARKSARARRAHKTQVGTFPVPAACTFAATASHVGASFTQCPHHGAKNFTNVAPVFVSISNVACVRTTGTELGSAAPSATADRATSSSEAGTARDMGVQCRATTRTSGGRVAVAPFARVRAILGTPAGLEPPKRRGVTVRYFQPVESDS